MRGLLDPQDIDPFAQGLLGMGAALMTPHYQGGGVGPAMMAFPQAQRQALEQQRAREAEMMRRRLYEAQIGQYDAVAQQRRVEAQREQEAIDRQRRIMERLGRGGPGAAQSAAPTGNLQIPDGMNFADASRAQQSGALPMLQSMAGAQPSAAPQGGSPSRMGLFNEYMRFAQAHEQEGDYERGLKYRELAKKSMPELKDQAVVIVKGKPTIRKTYKDGSEEDVTDAAPKADTTLDDFGGTKRLRNNYTGSYDGESIPVTMTEAQIAADKRALEQIEVSRANNRATLRGQDMTDARARELAALTREGMQAERESRTQERRDKEINADVSTLANRLDQAKVPAVGASIRNLNETLAKYTPQDVPGVGYTKNLPLATIMLSPEGKAVKSSISAVANDLMAMYSGLAVTLPEAERRALEEMRDGKFSAQDFYTAWPRVVARYNQVSGNIAAGVQPEAVQRYSSRPGAVNLAPVMPTQGRGKDPAAPFAPGATATPPAGGVIDFSTLKR